MKTHKTLSVFRRAFIWSAIGGLILNLVFDIYSYQKNRSSDQAGDQIIQSYNRIHHLERLNRAIEFYFLHPTSESRRDDVAVEIAAVKDLMTTARQRELLQEMMAAIDSPTPFGRATATKVVTGMVSTESHLLQATLNKDLFENQEVERSLLRGLVLDTLLNAVLFLFFIFEMRARGKTEENLRNSVNNLRDTNFALQEDLLRRKAKLKVAVHDLKNPLGSISGFAGLIADEGRTSPTVQEFSEIIKRISQNSLQLVESMLMQRDETSLELESLDLISIANEICLQTEAQAKLKNQTILRLFEVQAAPIMADRMKIEELLANLLSNAVKYSPRGTVIKVRCLAVKDIFRIEVEDEGPGFSQEDKIKAFQFGQKLSAKPTGNESSTGFGLYIAKQIVDHHGGSIEIIDSRSGPGACVAFELPMAVAHPIPPPENEKSQLPFEEAGFQLTGKKRKA